MVSLTLGDRNVIFQLAEVAVPPQLFAPNLKRIGAATAGVRLGVRLAAPENRGRTSLPCVRGAPRVQVSEPPWRRRA
jgi:hypothetical protein